MTDTIRVQGPDGTWHDISRSIRGITLSVSDVDANTAALEDAVLDRGGLEASAATHNPRSSLDLGLAAMRFGHALQELRANPPAPAGARGAVDPGGRRRARKSARAARRRNR